MTLVTQVKASVFLIDALAKPLPRSKTRCRTPLTAWKAKGKPRRANLSPPLTAKGRAAKAEARLADSRCQPMRGATR